MNSTFYQGPQKINKKKQGQKTILRPYSINSSMKKPTTKKHKNYRTDS